MVDFLEVWHYIKDAVRTHPFNAVTLLFAGLAVVISIVAACFSWRSARAAEYQAHVAEQTRLDMQSASQAQAQDVERSRKATEKSADAAAKLADGMNRSAGAAEASARMAEASVHLSREQVRLSRDAIISSERPVLELLGAKLAPPFLMKMRIKNSGKTSAIKPHFQARFEVFDVMIGADPILVHTEQGFDTHLLDTASSITAEWDAGGNDIAGFLSTHQARSYFRVKITGVIKYADMRGNDYALPLCYEGYPVLNSNRDLLLTGCLSSYGLQ